MFLCTSLDVATRMSERGVSLRLDDKPEAITESLRFATNRILMKLMKLYNQQDLVNDALTGGPDGNGGMTRDLATDLACCRLAGRRGNPVPASMKEACKEVYDDLESLSNDLDQLPNVPQSAPGYPAWSNLTIQDYVYKRVRVESQISDVPPTSSAYTQIVDWFGQYYIEY